MYGEIFSSSIKNFNYLNILKNTLNIQENTYEKSIFLSAVKKEISISEIKDTKIINIAKEENISNVIADEEKIVQDQNILANKVENKPPIEENIVYPVSTTIVQENNLLENFNTVYKDVKIKNETNFNLSQEILTPNINFSNKNIVIYHTHTCESYTKTATDSYIESGNYRTIDLNYSVSKVGSILAEHLKNKGLNVIHDTTYHDYPAYNGSYSRSFKTVKKILEKNQAQLVIDLHRDAVGSMNNYAPSVKINEDIVAQLMFVIGTNGGGLEHNNWQNNLKFAIKIQETANSMYPGLFKPIILRNSRYNQNLADSACIIEVGATGNTLEQTTLSMKYLSEVIFKVMN